MSLQKIGKLKTAFNNRSTQGVISALGAFGNVNTAGKWLGQINVGKNGQSIMTQEHMIKLLKGQYSNASEEEIISALNKGATSANMGNLALSGGSGILTSLKQTGAGLVSILKPLLPVIIGAAFAGLGIAAWKGLDNQFNLTKSTTSKKYENAKEDHESAQSELKTVKSEYDSNQERIQELRAKENRTLSEGQELNQLQDQNKLLGTQVSLKEKLVDTTQKAEADAANTDLNKKYNQQDYFADGSGNYNPQAKTYVNDMDEAQAMIDYIQYLQDNYDTAKANMIARRGSEKDLTQEDLDTLDKKQKSIDDQKVKLSEKISDISKSAESLVNEDGKVIDKKYQGTLDKVNSIVDDYLKLTGSASGTEDKINNLFALARFSDLQEKLESLGKSKGSKGILDALNNDDTYSNLVTALDDKNVSLKDLASYIMSIADPEALDLEGVKQNFKELMGGLNVDKNGKPLIGPSLYDSFFKNKSDEDIKDFWNYIETQGLNPKENNWTGADWSSNYKDYLKSKESVPDTKTFSSFFKNATEDAATDLDTVTDNFQSDMSSIKSAMDSLKSGDMKNSDLTDLIQQFPELANETDNLQNGLQNLAFDKASDAISKIRDYVKDTTDPEELAKADRYIQSILDNMNTADFDMSNSQNDVIKRVRSNLKGSEFLKDNAENTINKLYNKYGNDEVALQAIIKLSADPSMANASYDTWVSKVEDTKVQIQLDTSEKNLQDLSSELTRLQTDASNAQTMMDNKATLGQKVTAQDYNNLINNGNAQIANLNKQIKEYQNEIDTTRKNAGLLITDEDNEKIKSYQDQIQTAQMSIENMKVSQRGWEESIKNLPITNVTNLSSALSTAISETTAETGLGTDSIKELNTQFSDLTAQGIDISNLFSRSAKGIKLNTDRFQELAKVQDEIVQNKFTKEIEDQQKAIAGATNSTDLAKAQSELDNLLNRRAEYMAQYANMQSQLSDFQIMMNSDNEATEGDEYTKSKSKLEAAKELYDKGEVGTPQFKKTAKYFSQNGFDDADNFIENYNRLKKYYTDDASGPKAFVEDLATKGLATYKTLADGNEGWALSFSNTEEAANKMGMSLESFEAIIGRLGDYEFDTTFVHSLADGENQINDLTNDLITEQKKLSKMRADGASEQAIQDQEDVVDGLKQKISDTKEATNDYIAGESERQAKSLAEAKQTIKDLGDLRKEYLDPNSNIYDVDKAKDIEKEIQSIANENGIKLKVDSFEIDEDAYTQMEQKLQNQEAAKRQANKGSVDLTNRPQIQAQKLIDMGYKDVGDPNNQATVFSSAHSNKDGSKTVVVTPILPDGDVLEPDSLEKYANEILDTGKDSKGIGIRTFEGDDSIQQADSYANALHGVQEAFYGTDEAAKKSLDSLKNYSAQELLDINYGDGKYDEQFADAEKTVDALVKQFQDAGLSENNAQLAAEGLIQVLDDMGKLKPTPEVDSSEIEEAGEKAEETSAELQNLSGSHYTIQADLSTTGGTSELTNELASIPQGTTAVVDVSVNGEEEVDNLTSAMESVPDNTPVTITCDVQNQEQLDEINAKADELNAKGKQITVDATIRKDSKDVDSYKPKDKEAKAIYHIDAGEVNAWTPPVKGGTVNYHAGSATGTMTSIAHADGTAYNVLNMKPLSPANAAGNIAIPNNEKSLVNEVGTESIVRDGIWSLIPGGPHFQSLKKGDIIFSARQTQDLLNHGKTNNHARAYAQGTLSVNAYRSGSSAKAFGRFTAGAAKTPSANTHSSGNSGSGSSGSSGGSGSGGGSSSSSWEDPWKNVKDWFERVVQKLQNLIDVNKAKADNSSALSIQNRYLSNAIANTERLISNYTQGRKMYVQKAEEYANGIGLSASLKEKVQNGTINLESLSEDDKSKVEAYQKWYDKIVECDKAIEDLKSQEKDLYQQRLDNVTSKYDALKSVYENQNAILSSRNELRTELGYSQGVGSAYYKDIKNQRTNQTNQSAILTKEIEQYKKQLYQIKKKYGAKSTFYKESLAGLKELQSALEDSKKATAELTNQLDELAMTSAQYKTDKYDRASEKQSAYRDHKDANRYYDSKTGDFAEGITEADYKAAISTNYNTINALQGQKELIQQKMLTLQPGSEKYQEYADQLADLDKKILETTDNNAELKKSIIELRFKPFDNAQEKLDDLIEDYGNLRDMMDSDTFYNDDGSFTETGLANTALLSKEIDAYKQKIADYTKQLDLIEELKKKGMLTADQYKQYTQDAMDKIQQASKSLYSTQQNLLEMYEDKITKENDLLQDNIAKRKDALSAKKDYYDFDKTLKDKTKDINALKAQIAALEGTTNAAAKAKLAKLKADLKDKEDDLADTKYEHQLDMEEKGYDNLSDQADDALDNTLKALKSNTELQKSVINDMLAEVKQSYKDTFAEISKIIEDTGYKTSELFKNNFNENSGNLTDETVNDAKKHPGEYTNVDTSGIPENTNASNAVNGAVKDSQGSNAANNIGYDSNGRPYDASYTGKDKKKHYYNQLALSLSPKSAVLYVGKKQTVKVSYGGGVTTTSLKNFTFSVSDSSVVSVTKTSTGSFTVTGKKSGKAVVTVNPTIQSAASVKFNVTVRQKTYDAHAKTVDSALNKSGYGFTDQERQAIKDSLILGKSESSLNNKKAFNTQIQNAIQKKVKEKLGKWYNSLKNKSFKKADYAKKHELVQHFNKKGKDVSAAQLKEAADILGLKYPKAYSKWTGKQKTNLLKKLQGYGFSKGGVVRDLIPADMSTLLGNAIIRNGDTGFIGARPGETVLTEEFTKQLRPTVAAMNEFTGMMKNEAPSINRIPSVQNQNITFSPEINLNVESIDSDLDIQDLAKQLNDVMYDNFTKKMSKDLRKLTGRNR